MARNACTNHPKSDIVDIPEGTKYCLRCRHLIPPEAEPEPVIDIVPLHTGSANTPSEQPLEPESVEAIAPPAEVQETPLEEATEVSERQKESPEETAPAEGLEPIEEEVVAESPETEVEAVKPDFVEAVTAVSLGEAIELDKNAEIALLKAKLAELEKIE